MLRGAAQSGSTVEAGAGDPGLPQQALQLLPRIRGRRWTPEFRDFVTGATVDIAHMIQANNMIMSQMAEHIDKQLSRGQLRNRRTQCDGMVQSRLRKPSKCYDLFRMPPAYFCSFMIS
jgi:hypothetical protein